MYHAGNTEFITSIKEGQAWNFKGAKICFLYEQTKKIDLAYSEVCKARMHNQQYRGADKSLARPGRKQATATKL